MNRLRILFPLLPQLLFLLFACSPEAQQSWGNDLAKLTTTQPAQADSIGWRHQHQQPSAAAFKASGNHTGLSEAQLAKLFHLAWPQSPDAMLTTLGHPEMTDPEGGQDYWPIKNGQYLTVYYSNGVSIGFSIGDSGGI